MSESRFSVGDAARTRSEHDTGSKRVLWLCPKKPDNISTGRRRIAEGLADRGHDVTQTQSRRECLSLLQDGADVLLTTTAVGGILGPIAQRRGIPHVMDYVDPISQMYRSDGFAAAAAAQTLRTVAMRTADGVIFVYESERERVRTHAQVARKTTLGVNYGRFANPHEAVEDAAMATLASHDAPDKFAIYVGGLEPIYDIRGMCRAFEAADIPLVVAGTGSLTDYVEHRAAVSSQITYLGVVEHDTVPGLLVEAALGVSLVDDPHTVKTLEYAAAGLPMLLAGGRAEAELPESDSVVFTDGDVTPEDVLTAWSRDGGCPTLSVWAEGHDYAQIVSDYETMIQRVL